MSLAVRIIAPTGRDPALLQAILVQNGVPALILKDLSVFNNHVETIGPLLIAEEALTPALTARLRNFVQNQPSWSDIPLLIVRRAPFQSNARTLFTEEESVLNFGLPVYLERPLRTSTLVSSVNAAIRARKRQYESRDAIQQRDDALAELEREREILIRSEKLAAVGRLAASISHEINNPLEAVTNLLYLAQHTPDLPDEVIKLLSSADEELRRVSQIVSHTLRFHRQSTHARSITPRELFEPTLGIYRGRLLNSGITLETDHRDEKPLTCFEGDIRQVLNNLIGNAIDAMRNGGTLRIRTHATSLWHGATPGPAIRITVADTGSGITQDSRLHLFEPFFTTKGINGTGLGLWISHGIIEKHAGLLQVRSSTQFGSSGTVFSILLPTNPQTE